MNYQSQGTSICYVLPECSRNSASHFSHVPEFLRKLSERVPIFLLVERGEAPDTIPSLVVRVQTQADSGRIRRYAELLSIVRELRSKGCRRFFVRISQGTALVLSLLKNRLDIEVFYWNSGATKLAWPSWRAEPMVRARLVLGDIVTRVLLHRVDRLITGPESMVAYYAENYGLSPNRCIVLYNDIDLQKFVRPDPTTRAEARKRLNLADATFVVLFVGRLSRYKGGRLLPQLVEQLHAAVGGRAFQMLVVGEAHLPEVADALRSKAAVRLVGAVPNADLQLYYSAADAFVLPSLSEGFPRVVLEAMACGLPIVAFDVGGVRDVLGPLQQELVHPAGRTDLLAKSLDRVARDVDVRSAVAEENLDRVQRYSTNTVADMFIERIVNVEI